MAEISQDERKKIREEERRKIMKEMKREKHASYSSHNSCNSLSEELIMKEDDIRKLSSVRLQFRKSRF